MRALKHLMCACFVIVLASVLSIQLDAFTNLAYGLCIVAGIGLVASAKVLTDKQDAAIRANIEIPDEPIERKTPKPYSWEEN